MTFQRHTFFWVTLYVLTHFTFSGYRVYAAIHGRRRLSRPTFVVRSFVGRQICAGGKNAAVSMETKLSVATSTKTARRHTALMPPPTAPGPAALPRAPPCPCMKLPLLDLGRAPEMGIGRTSGCCRPVIVLQAQNEHARYGDRPVSSSSSSSSPCTLPAAATGDV